MNKRNLRFKISDFRLRVRRDEMPKVNLPLGARLLRATGCLHVCVIGINLSKNEWIYTTQFRRWHPLSWVLMFFAAQFVALCYFMISFRQNEWRSRNG